MPAEREACSLKRRNLAKWKRKLDSAMNCRLGITRTSDTYQQPKCSDISHCDILYGMSGGKGQEPREYSSPACSMHEADEQYMGYAGLSELVGFLQELLEAERAGARVCLESARAAEGTTRGQLLSLIHQDEARWCGMLGEHLRQCGQIPSTKVGAFHEKAMAITDPKLRMDLLNRGQGWVVRRLRDMLPRVRDERLYADLTEMLQSHESNIARVNASEAETP